jgi:DNA invertase Pin-like site-specific DNA recombinase
VGLVEDRAARADELLDRPPPREVAVGVQFVSLDDGIDTSTPAGRLFMQIRGAFAEYERGLIVERTKAGLEVARRRGKRFGRPPLPRRQRERILRLRRAGRSIRAIAQQVAVAKSTVERVVKAAA